MVIGDQETKVLFTWYTIKTQENWTSVKFARGYTEN